MERDGERVHQSVHAVQGAEENVHYGAVADCTRSDTAGDYTVFARVDGHEWVPYDLADVESSREVTCTAVGADYRHGGTQGFSFGTEDSCANVRRYDGGCGFAEATTAETD